MTHVRLTPGITTEEAAAIGADARDIEIAEFERTYGSVADGIIQGALGSDDFYVAHFGDTILGAFGVSSPDENGLRAPWLVLTKAATEHPFMVAREARRIVEGWSGRFGHMLNFVPTRDETAIKLLEFCGFRVDRSNTIVTEPEEYFVFQIGEPT